MRGKHLFLALGLLCLLAAACSDDDPVKPEEFAVTIKVTDAGGAPVEGIRVHLVNDHIYFQDGGLAAKAATVIPFIAELPAHVVLTIEDIEGAVVRRLYEGDIAKGSFRWMWDGLDDAGVHMPSGRYTAHLVCTNPDTRMWMFEDRTDMLLSMLDASMVPAGYTDADGLLVLRDRRLFPHLYGRPAMMATNENGDIMGEIELGPVMRVCLSDTLTGGGFWAKRTVEGAKTLEFVWAPPPSLEDPASDPEPLFPGVARTDTTNPEYFRLGLVYPNPFN